MAGLTDELVEFIRSIGGGMLCTRDVRMRVFPHECFIANVSVEGITGLVPAHLARGLAENVADNGQASLVISRVPGDHRTAQLKGRITGLDAPDVRQAEFAPTIEPMVASLAKLMPEDNARAIMDAASRTPVFRVHFDIMELFNQSPGPGAGQPIAGGAR